MGNLMEKYFVSMHIAHILRSTSYVMRLLFDGNVVAIFAAPNRTR